MKTCTHMSMNEDGCTCEEQHLRAIKDFAEKVKIAAVDHCIEIDELDDLIEALVREELGETK